MTEHITGPLVRVHELLSPCPDVRILCCAIPAVENAPHRGHGDHCFANHANGFRILRQLLCLPCQIEWHVLRDPHPDSDIRLPRLRRILLHVCTILRQELPVTIIRSD